MTEIVLAVLPEALNIHRLPAATKLSQVLADIGAEETPSLFASLQSQHELSIVCDAVIEVKTLEAEHTTGPWRAIHVVGELDFALTGILSGLTEPLAAARISIFAISSFDTDYLLVRADKLEAAVVTLERAGYSFSPNG